MELINKPEGNCQLQNEQQNQKENSLEDLINQSAKSMARLWTNMASIYGHKWNSSFGEAAVINGNLTVIAKMWATGLIDIDPQGISDGLNACIKSGESWPPTLPEFIKLCVGCNELPDWNDDGGYMALGKKLNLNPGVGELMVDYKSRIKRELLLDNRETTLNKMKGLESKQHAI